MRRERDRVDHERFALPPADRMTLHRGLDFVRMRGHPEMHDAQRVDALGVESHSELILAELDRAQERQDRQRGRGSGCAVGGPCDRPLRGCASRTAGFAQWRRLGPQARQEDGELIDVGHPVAFDSAGDRGDRSRFAAPALCAQRMDGAVCHGDVEAQHDPTGTAAIGPRTHRDRRALRQVLATEPVGPHCRERADLDLLEEGGAVGTSRLDLEVDVRIPPRDLRDRALDVNLVVQIVGRLAVVGECGGRPREYGGESGNQGFHRFLRGIGMEQLARSA